MHILIVTNIIAICVYIYICIHRVYPFTGLDYRTGIFNWTTGVSYLLFRQVSVFILRLATLF